MIDKSKFEESITKDGGLQFLNFESDYGVDILEKFSSIYKDVSEVKRSTAFFIAMKLFLRNALPKDVEEKIYNSFDKDWLDSDIRGYLITKEGAGSDAVGDHELFFKQSNILGSLYYLSKNDEARALKVVRSLLLSNKKEGISVLALALKTTKFKKDINALITVIKGMYEFYTPELRQALFNQLFNISDKSPEFIKRLSEEGLVKLLLQYLRHNPDLKHKDYLLTVLNSENDTERVLACLALGKIMSKDELKILQEGYTKGKYYYNVMSWLDRLIYGDSYLILYNP